MSGVPYVFGNATTSIPLSQLDVNFATNATIGTTSVGLGNTTTTLVGLTNVSTTVVNTSNVSANTSLLLQTNGGTTAVTIDNTQNVTFANSIGFGSNAGITFNNSSALTNSLLNDYETGTWTPQISFGGATTGITYNTQAGSYTKIGRQVIAYAQVYLSSKGSATGTATLTGLPFTSTSSANGNGVGAVGYNYSFATTFTWLNRVQDSSAYVVLAKGGIPSDATQLTNSDFNNNSIIQITCIYQSA